MDKKKTLKQQIYSSIFQEIIEGKYLPGDIMSENALVEKFNVSKSPVREALIELCNEQVLRCIPRYGYEVVSLTESDVKNIQEFRQILECSCLEKNWSYFTPEQIAKIEHLAHHSPDDKELNAISQWESNAAFHLALASCYNNKYIYEALKKSINILTRAFAQFYWDKWRKARLPYYDNTQHKLIVKYIKADDKEKALSYLYKDLDKFKRDSY
ncbi:MAG: GntR family transcriptional regulator [Firmicutes bacterium]|nr:GntR family transcriptional regulator [Bacillota bacterium]